MAFQIQGINRILKKLDNLTNIDIKEEVVEVAESMQNKLREQASTFSKNGYKCIAKCEIRNYKGANCFADVGLKNDNAPFDLWKNLYFQNFGYRQFYYGNDLGYINTNNILWFDNAVNQAAKEIQNQLKNKLKEKVKEALEG